MNCIIEKNYSDNNKNIILIPKHYQISKVDDIFNIKIKKIIKSYEAINTISVENIKNDNNLKNGNFYIRNNNKVIIYEKITKTLTGFFYNTAEVIIQKKISIELINAINTKRYISCTNKKNKLFIN